MHTQVNRFEMMLQVNFTLTWMIYSTRVFFTIIGYCSSNKYKKNSFEYYCSFQSHNRCLNVSWIISENLDENKHYQEWLANLLIVCTSVHRNNCWNDSFIVNFHTISSASAESNKTERMFAFDGTFL